MCHTVTLFTYISTGFEMSPTQSRIHFRRDISKPLVFESIARFPLTILTCDLNAPKRHIAALYIHKLFPFAWNFLCVRKQLRFEDAFHWLGGKERPIYWQPLRNTRFGSIY